MASGAGLKVRVTSASVLAGVALVVAGCGSSTSSSSTTATSAAKASSSASGAAKPVAAVTVSTAKGSAGTYLTGASGRALYMWVADPKGRSACSGACAQAWPPLITKAKATGSKGVTSADLGTITRSDGSRQVTYNGHPLYYFVEDPAAGTTKGQGSDNFGAKWWLVAPSGTAITSATQSSSSPASGGSAGGAY